MRHHLSRLLLLLGSAALAFAAPKLRIGVENNAPPLSFVDAAGKPAGFSAELLTEMARVGGFEVEIVPNPWKTSFELFQAGKVDALANLTITEARLKEIDFSVGHAYIHGVVFYRSGQPALRRTADFAGKKLATLSGSIATSNAQKHDGWGATIQVFSSWQAALDATARGECDAALFISRPSATGTNEHGLRREFVDDIIHQFHFGVHKGDSATLAQLNASLATLLHNGAFDRIYSKWIGPIEPHPIRFADLRPYYWPVGAGLAALVAFVGWQRYMMRRLARQAEALRLSEERWKFALEGESAAVWDWDATTDTVMYSPLWKTMLGYAENDLGHDTHEWTKRIHPEDRARVEAAIAAHRDRQGAPFAVEYRLQCKDGGWKWVLGHGMVVHRDAAGKALRMIGTHTDLTARKQAEADRLVLGKLESTGILAGGIAHDFNNLLTTIVLNLDLAQSGPMNRENLAPRLRDIQKAALAARDLTQQLITFAKGGDPVRRPLNLSRLLRDSVPLALSGSTARSEIAIAADLWPAEVDEGQVGQLIRNLVLNAQEAMPGGGTVSLRAENVRLRAGEVQALPAGDYVRISVTDQGSGIPPDVLPAIFDPYFSTKQRGTQKGMGLGLTICHSVAQKHGGAIVVETAPGVGTAFHVYLPACGQSVPAESAPPAIPDARPAPGRILVMDDEVWMRESVGLALTRMGYAVELAADGQAAVELYTQARNEGRPFSTVILDLTVRGAMGGLEALRALRAIDPAVHAVVMSGYANNEVLREYARHGFRGAMTKPFSIETLRHAVTAGTAAA
jgi:PAS domain S-box-containing protein